MASNISTSLEAASPGITRSRVIDRLALAHDASHYSFEPELVVVPRTIQDVQHTLKAAQTHGKSVTFRAGGTSLGGQASTDSLLVDTRRHFKQLRVLDDGLRVEVEPGVTVRAVNARLARYGRKLGPDPASEIACTIGGVIANNSSGMTCGTTMNTYRTLESAVIVLASGIVIDTADADADDQLRLNEPKIHEGLRSLRARVLGDPESISTLDRLFAIKNTMGFGLNSLVDYSTPVDMLLHLMVGSEGALGYIAKATFRTIPLKNHAATSLLVFPDLETAIAQVASLADLNIAAVELLDSRSLQVAQKQAPLPASIADLVVNGHAALLIEYQAQTLQEVIDFQEQHHTLIRDLPTVTPSTLSQDRTERDLLWRLRKGLYASVAGNRAPNTLALLEDVAVPLNNLSLMCAQLSTLLDEHGYEDSVIFGHAKDGNIHFMLSERFDDDLSRSRYEAFTEDMVSLVLGHGGTLKAEHGTGRMMAPYVERQYGSELFGVMVDLKHLLDPQNVLNPGVVITSDHGAHMQNLKAVTVVEDEVNRCVDCGYCESSCPSAALTLTPRQRIAIRREMEIAASRSDKARVAALRRDFVYDGVHTCAVDGLCELACPLGINTGDLVKKMRQADVSSAKQSVWAFAAKHWQTTTKIAAVALNIAAKVPVLSSSATRLGRKVLGEDAVPLWTADLPKGGNRRTSHKEIAPQAVYFPSCTSSMFESGVVDAFHNLCRIANIKLDVPEGIGSLCCGTPWKSKGLNVGYQHMVTKSYQNLREATKDWALPIVVDASSCTEGLKQLIASAGGADRAVVLDVTAFTAEQILPKITVKRPLSEITLLTNCSATRLGLEQSLKAIAEKAAKIVKVPDQNSCCGFAGDRGMLHPELTATATQQLAYLKETAEPVVTSNRTCEIGLSRAAGRPVTHVLEILASVATAG